MEPSFVSQKHQKQNQTETKSKKKRLYPGLFNNCNLSFEVVKDNKLNSIKLLNYINKSK